MANHAHNQRNPKFAPHLEDVSGPRYMEKLHQHPSFSDDWQQCRKGEAFSKSYHRDTSYFNGIKKDFGATSFVRAVKGDRGSHHHSNNVKLNHHHIFGNSRHMGNLLHGKFHSHERNGWNAQHLSIQGHGRGRHTHCGNGHNLNGMHGHGSYNYGRSGYKLVPNPGYHGDGKKFYIHDQGKGVKKSGKFLGRLNGAGSNRYNKAVTSTGNAGTVNFHDVQPAGLQKNYILENNLEHINSLTHNTQPSSPSKTEKLPCTSVAVEEEEASIPCQRSLLLEFDPSLPVNATSIGVKRDRAFITCRHNKKRLRSSAVRDYPAGCIKYLVSVKEVSSASRNHDVLKEETSLTDISKEAGSLELFQPVHEGSFGECDNSDVNGEAGTAANGIQVFLDIMIEHDNSKLSQHRLGVSNEDTQKTSDVDKLLGVTGNEGMVKSSAMENSNKGDDSPNLVQSEGRYFHEDTIEPKICLEVGNIVETPFQRNSCELVLEDSHVLVDYCGKGKSPFDSPQEDRDSRLKRIEESPSLHPRVDGLVTDISSTMISGHVKSSNMVSGLLQNGDELRKIPQALEFSENMGGASMKNDDLRQAVEISQNVRTLVPYQSKKKLARMKNKNPKQDSEISGNAGALVLYESNENRTNGKHKDLGRRLIHKGSTRPKIYQDSRSVDGGMFLDLEKALRPEANEGVSARTLVKRTLQEFECLRKMLVKSQDGVKDGIKRADLDAGGIMKKKGKWRNCGEKIVGEVPGVEVGDQFSFRMEMLIIGLHRQVQAGIDYIPASRRSNKAPLATSIVASGGYEDDKDDGNMLIYTGQGGKSNKGVQGSNQELVRGNLALSNSMEEKNPVRVIRGTPDPASPSSKVYTYDGLYDVVGLRFEYGSSGYQVFHFTLMRRPGQPQVGLSFLSSLKRKGIARPHLLLDDISQGQERLPVCVVNEVDEEPAPLHFIYIANMKYPLWYVPLTPQGCDCVGGCFDEEKCSCALKNEGELPYNDDGYIIRDKKVVFECGRSCRCSNYCQNRVSQKGLRYRLEIFKTKNRGWGVRSLNSIQSGGFICEYVGELLSDAEAEKRVENDEYLFDLGHECNPSRAFDEPAGDDGSNAIVPVLPDVSYTIDAKDMGNVARFINHSCSPNLYAQNVLYDSDDLRFPHVMLFAMENIPPMRELTYDYNYSLDQVRDAHGNLKTKACYCGAQDCKGRLY